MSIHGTDQVLTDRAKSCSFPLLFLGSLSNVPIAFPTKDSDFAQCPAHMKQEAYQSVDIGLFLTKAMPENEVVIPSVSDDRKQLVWLMFSLS